MKKTIQKVKCSLGWHGASEYIGRSIEIRRYSYGDYRVQYHVYLCQCCNKFYKEIDYSEAIRKHLKLT